MALDGRQGSPPDVAHPTPSGATLSEEGTAPGTRIAVPGRSPVPTVVHTPLATA
ncbi:hypothetical protein ACFYRD_08975 [Streptomyces hirsutus]|uniref:hypothetical protein n=1 Tax=Streptomyces hirsutus TaxID=35620 RepID=UPI0036C360D0